MFGHIIILIAVAYFIWCIINQVINIKTNGMMMRNHLKCVCGLNRPTHNNNSHSHNNMPMRGKLPNTSSGEISCYFISHINMSRTRTTRRGKRRTWDELRIWVVSFIHSVQRQRPSGISSLEFIGPPRTERAAYYLFWTLLSSSPHLVDWCGLCVCGWAVVWSLVFRRLIIHFRLNNTPLLLMCS